MSSADIAGEPHVIYEHGEPTAPVASLYGWLDSKAFGRRQNSTGFLINFAIGE
jgi:hypothetical protein